MADGGWPIIPTLVIGLGVTRLKSKGGWVLAVGGQSPAPWTGVSCGNPSHPFSKRGPKDHQPHNSEANGGGRMADQSSIGYRPFANRPDSPRSVGQIKLLEDRLFDLIRTESNWAARRCNSSQLDGIGSSWSDSALASGSGRPLVPTCTNCIKLSIQETA